MAVTASFGAPPSHSVSRDVKLVKIKKDRYSKKDHSHSLSRDREEDSNEVVQFGGPIQRKNIMQSVNVD